MVLNTEPTNGVYAFVQRSSKSSCFSCLYQLIRLQLSSQNAHSIGTEFYCLMTVNYSDAEMLTLNVSASGFICS